MILIFTAIWWSCLHRGDGYIEMDINVHRFASVPKKALQIVAKWYVLCSSLYLSTCLLCTLCVWPETGLDCRAHRDLILSIIALILCMHDITSNDIIWHHITQANITLPAMPCHDLDCSLDRMTIHMGFCIEAKDEAEMPEVLFGCVQLNNPTVDKHPKWDHAK